MDVESFSKGGIVMPQNILQIADEIKVYVTKQESAGGEEQLLAAAKCLSSYRLDRKFYGELFGLDSSPRLVAVIDTLPADYGVNTFGALWPNPHWGALPLERAGCDMELVRLLGAFQQCSRQPLTQPRTAYDVLEETFARVEREGSDEEIRLAISCIALLPESHSLRHTRLLEGKPRVQAALKIDPEKHGVACTGCRQPSSPGVIAFVDGILHQLRDRDDIKGRVATLIIHYEQEQRR